MTFEQLKQEFPYATLDTWHQHPNGGGWVETTAHVEDSARVYGNAAVYGNAWVCGNARVHGNARVYGNARVSGDARVSGNARVHGDAWVCGNARVYEGNFEASPTYIQGSRYEIYQSTDDGLTITSGCISQPLAWWDEHVERCAEEHGYTPAQQMEYRAYVELFKRLAEIRSSTKEQK